ncbi:hypothetical protein M5K25_025371 [Dendrobium thyrsiflorum]|uniref:BZIP domain-containing protein n=1 Tax=Dendrobium thyrsiflorum TaxID=117978 RepID=A0ABD0U4A4_DENTH
MKTSCSPMAQPPRLLTFAPLGRSWQRKCGQSCLAQFIPSSTATLISTSSIIAFDSSDQMRSLTAFPRPCPPLPLATATCCCAPQRDHDREDTKPHSHNGILFGDISFSSSWNWIRPSIARVLVELDVTKHYPDRILANRQSARRSRERKLQYISELQKCVGKLETEIAALTPRVAFFDCQRSMLVMQNSQLKQQIAVLAQKNIIKDACQETLKREIGRLSEVRQRQNLTKTDAMMAAIDAGGEDTATIFYQNDLRTNP